MGRLPADEESVEEVTEATREEDYQMKRDAYSRGEKVGGALVDGGRGRRL